MCIVPHSFPLLAIKCEIHTCMYYTSIIISTTKSSSIISDKLGSYTLRVLVHTWYLTYDTNGGERRGGVSSTDKTMFVGCTRTLYEVTLLRGMIYTQSALQRQCKQLEVVCVRVCLLVMSRRLLPVCCLLVAGGAKTNRAEAPTA